MMVLRVKGIVSDKSGNEQEVDVFFDVEGQRDIDDGATVGELSGCIGWFKARAIPGKFNPWGPTDSSALASNGEVKP